MRVLCLVLLAVGAMAAPQSSPEAPKPPPSTDSTVRPPSPSAGGETTGAPTSPPPLDGVTTGAPPSVATEKQPAAGNVTEVSVLNINNITVIGVMDENTKEEVDEIVDGYDRLRNLGVFDLEDEPFEEAEEAVVAGAATFKIKKLIKLAKIALIVMATQNRTTPNVTTMAMQVQRLVQLLNLRDPAIASNALEVVRAAQEQGNVAEQLAFEEEEATKKVVAALAQVPDTAVASLQGAAHGQILFAQSGGATVVMGTLVGLRPGQHHMTIYERGNCRVPGQRFDYSGIGESSLGTVLADDTGRATILFRSAKVALAGPRGVLGRTVVVAPAAEGRDRPPIAVSAAYAAAQFVPSLDELLAQEESGTENYAGDFSCGIIVRE